MKFWPPASGAGLAAAMNEYNPQDFAEETADEDNESTVEQHNQHQEV